VRERDELPDHLSEADVLVIFGFWGNELLERAPKLRFIQSIGAGTDQFDRDLLRGRGVRLASAKGVNERAVSQHAMALILAMARRLPEARDNQSRGLWRGMISDLAQREDENRNRRCCRRGRRRPCGCGGWWRGGSNCHGARWTAQPGLLLRPEPSPDNSCSTEPAGHSSGAARRPPVS
jgi:hypothetical protein